MTRAILAVIFLLAGCSKFGSGVVLPPAEYDHPYAGRLIVQTLSIWEMPAACGLRHVEACSFRMNGVCRVIYPKLADVGADTMVALIRHETAHCNGWAGDHPGGHY